MPNKPWWRPLLAFLITFGALAMVASLVRVVVVYDHFFALGMRTDDPQVAADATQELSRLDRLYSPLFLGVATAVSGLMAGVFAWWRPAPRIPLPPPLPGERRTETR